MTKQLSPVRHDGLCRMCGKPHNKAPNAFFCAPCYEARSHELQRAHTKKKPADVNRRVQRLKINGASHCLDCRVEFEIAPGCRAPLRCPECNSKRYFWLNLLSQHAHGRVQQAVKLGQLPHFSTLQCVDCGRHAECYDHRDYAKPLDVDAVCRSCNLTRWHAKGLESTDSIRAMVLQRLPSKELERRLTLAGFDVGRLLAENRQQWGGA